jgi:hypothetical protein
VLRTPNQLRTTMKPTTLTLASAFVLSSTFALAHTTHHPRYGSGGSERPEPTTTGCRSSWPKTFKTQTDTKPIHSIAAQARPLRVWNGIFAAGDWRAKKTSSSLERDFCRRRLARQKGPEDDISAQRREIGDHHTREMAAKTAFVLAGLNI